MVKYEKDKSHLHYKCKCKCGNEIIVDKRSLYSSNFKSCGCANSLVGKTYGKLTVIHIYKDNIRKNLREWECLCECGKTYFTREENLLRGNRTNCGCIKRKMKYENLINNKYNMLTVIDKADDYITPKGIPEIRWKCKCDCGNPKDVIVGSYNLKSGKVKSCGCYKIKKAKEKYDDLTGLKFGYLTVKERVGYRVCGNRNQIIWSCDCKCGNKDILVLASNLKNNSTTSCGCRQKETQFKRMYNKYDFTKTYGIGYTSNTNNAFFFVF